MELYHKIKNDEQLDQKFNFVFMHWSESDYEQSLFLLEAAYNMFKMYKSAELKSKAEINITYIFKSKYICENKPLTEYVLNLQETNDRLSFKIINEVKDI